jgi:hypothetical protein
LAETNSTCTRWPAPTWLRPKSWPAQDLADQGTVGVRGQPEVDEAGTGDLHPRHQRRGRQGVHQLLRQIARLGARGLGQHHGQIGGEVAVL